MPYKITNTSKKPNGKGRNRNGYTIAIGDRTIYHGSSAMATDELWLNIEKKMAELAAIGDVKIEPVGISKTPDIVKNLEGMISDERARALERNAATTTPSTSKNVAQTGYENNKDAAVYDPNIEEDDLSFSEPSSYDDPDGPAPVDNFTVVARSPDSMKKKRK